MIVPLFKTSLTKETELVATDPPELIVVLPREPDPSPFIIPVTLTVPERFEALLIVRAPGVAPVVETAPVTERFEIITP